MSKLSNNYLEEENTLEELDEDELEELIEESIREAANYAAKKLEPRITAIIFYYASSQSDILYADNDTFYDENDIYSLKISNIQLEISDDRSAGIIKQFYTSDSVEIVLNKCAKDKIWYREDMKRSEDIKEIFLLYSVKKWEGIIIKLPWKLDEYGYNLFQESCTDLDGRMHISISNKEKTRRVEIE